jgi:hypothetical protein
MRVVVSGVFVGDHYGCPCCGFLAGAQPHGEHERYETYRVCRGRVFLATEVTAVLLYQPVLRDGNYLVGPDTDNRVLLGGLLELLLVVAVIGTAVTLYPVVKRQNHSVALGYVAAGCWRRRSSWSAPSAFSHS